MIKKSFFKIAAPLFLSAVLLFSGCGSARTALSSDEVQSAAKSVGYTVNSQDISSSSKLDAYLAGAQQSDPSLQMAFVQFKEESDAKDFYSQMRDAYSSRAGLEIKETNSDTYTTMTAQGGDLYYGFQGSAAPFSTQKEPFQIKPPQMRFSKTQNIKLQKAPCFSARSFFDR